MEEILRPYCRVGFFWRFIEIATESFLRATDANQHLEALKQAGMFIDPDGRKVYYKGSEIDEYETIFDRETLITCVFLSLFLEGYINDFGGTTLTDEYFKVHLDRINTVSKWLIIPKLVTGTGLREDSEHFRKLRKLFDLRNKIVHHKSKDGFQYLDRNSPNFKKLKKEPRLEMKCYFLMVRDLFIELDAIDPKGIHTVRVRHSLKKIGIDIDKGSH